MNVTQPVLGAGEIPDKWYSEKRLTSLESTREGVSSELQGEEHWCLGALCPDGSQSRWVLMQV